MLRVTQAVKCPNCGHDIITYSMNTNQDRLLFNCGNCNHTVPLSVDEYSTYVKESKTTKKVF